MVLSKVIACLLDFRVPHESNLFSKTSLEPALYKMKSSINRIHFYSDYVL